MVIIWNLWYRISDFKSSYTKIDTLLHCKYLLSLYSQIAAKKLYCILNYSTWQWTVIGCTLIQPSYSQNTVNDSSNWFSCTFLEKLMLMTVIGQYGKIVWYPVQILTVISTKFLSLEVLWLDYSNTPIWFVYFYIFGKIVGIQDRFWL